ncbi:MAG: hypothetical protein ACN4GT_03385 [Gammaproteobacteria bacterium]
MKLSFAVLLTLAVTSCMFIGDLDPVDLDAPGWQVWTGQATWRRNAEAPRLAGDIVAARRDNDDVFVNFSKAALPLFSAQTADGKWQIEFVERGRDYSGRGKPPKRFAWFFLPALLADPTAELEGWSVDRPAADELVLENPETGEIIRMFLDP